jgi:hypothetical protein
MDVHVHVHMHARVHVCACVRRAGNRRGRCQRGKGLTVAELDAINESCGDGAEGREPARAMPPQVTNSSRNVPLPST